jgi:phage-related protein
MKIEYYTSSGGESYVEEVILMQAPKMIKKILKTIDMIIDWGVGPSSRAGMMKKLHGYDLYEILVDFNKIFFRILCVLKDGVLYLLSAFCKKSPNTPDREIDTALKRAKQLNTLLAFH